MAYLRKINVFKLFLLGLALGYATSSNAVDSTPSQPPNVAKESYFQADGWHENALGYRVAFSEAVTEKKPVLIYIYAPWCPYCRRFEQNILSRPETRQFLKGFVKVRIYPDIGDAEAAISDRLGVTGYPSIFVKPVNTNTVTAIDLLKPEHDEYVLKTPAEFIKTLHPFVK